VAEAKKVLDLVTRVGLPHGYLENQVFAPPVEAGKNLLWARGAKLTGRPYLARAAEAGGTCPGSGRVSRAQACSTHDATRSLSCSLLPIRRKPIHGSTNG
jgi:hypothetical protein